MKALVYILTVVSFFGCQSDFDKLQGHWHSLSNDGSYVTLDVKDSAVFLNKLNRHGECLEEKILIENGTIIMPLAYHYSFNFYVSFNEDTLILREYNASNAYEIRFLKHEKSIDRIKHLNSDFNSLLNSIIELEINNNSLVLDSVTKRNRWTIIDIGYPKGKTKSMVNLDSDSLFVSYANSTLMHEDLGEIIQIETKGIIYTDEKINKLQKSVLIINADKSTPVLLLDSICDVALNTDCIKNIYRTCVNPEKNAIGLYKLR